jgi:aspartate carbamoyltransferase catalytic subunit
LWRSSRFFDFSNLNAAIVGDAPRSRVARSDLHALHIFGASVAMRMKVMDTLIA